MRKTITTGGINAFTSMAFLFLLLPVITGCTPAIKIDAAIRMTRENPIKKIAVISSSTVVWPKVVGNEAVIGMQESMAALEKLLPQTNSILAQKGYSVVFGEPAIIGSVTTGDLAMSEGEQINSNGGEAQTLSSASYPVVNNNPRLDEVSRHVFRKWQEDLNNNKQPVFRKDDVHALSEITGADTICLNRVLGTKYSTTRKVATAVGNTATVMVATLVAIGPVITSPLSTLIIQATGDASDKLIASFHCVDTETGLILWRNGRFSEDDPINPDKEFLEELFRYFPEVNKPMNPENVNM